jgi:hypothetical protein
MSQELIAQAIDIAALVESGTRWCSPPSGNTCSVPGRVHRKGKPIT